MSNFLVKFFKFPNVLIILGLLILTLVEVDRRTYRSYNLTNIDNTIEVIESIFPSTEYTIICHGFAGSKEMMRQLAYDIANAGSNALLIDFIGHGSNRQRLINKPAEITGTTQQLVDQLSEIIKFVYEKFGNEISISLVGHSMASDIVIRASTDNRIKSVVAISPYSTGITYDFPKNLLLISGQFEKHLRLHALEMVKTFNPQAEENIEYSSKNVRRKASFIKNTGHVSVIYSSDTSKIIIDWLKLKNYDRPFWLTQIGWIIIGITLFVIGISRLNLNLTKKNLFNFEDRRPLRAVFFATVCSLSAGLIKINVFPVYGFEKIAIYFGILGLFAYLFSTDFQIKNLKFNARLCLTLILFFCLLCFLINRYIGSFALNENRLSAFLTLIVPISLFCLVIEKLIASSSIAVALLLRILPIIGFSILLILFPEEYGLMFTTLLIYILYFVVFGYIGKHQRKTIGHLEVGLSHGIFLSFSFAATNPIFSA